ncbi:MULTISPECIES: hypothetical protein [Kosmotoga]|jgi:hypothetical protein|uniref:Uncharacterized protein n=1 Tax=Kosmotoga olearia (strain ATCC BAA-1733 / DSM 21960 / TBF 19.5.1) TaxID=521045 RepID=C5CDM8_KOSOT|nr:MULTISPECIES: hypothetical protein [Kosmotoga]ACR80040.1 hypothetical protein Kole_1346 [Kosmotoga olearia TBF 19.5.1]MDI3524412.1 hypothetical protein [Kosmotoga sp.]
MGIYDRDWYKEEQKKLELPRKIPKGSSRSFIFGFITGFATALLLLFLIGVI